MYYFYEGRTIRGIGLAGWALIILTIAVVVMGATLAVVGVLAPALVANPTMLLGPLVGAVAAICSAAVAELAAGIVFLVAFYQIHAGRHEYGLEQTRSLDRALIFLIVYIVLYAVSAVYSSSFSVLFGTGATSNVGVTAGSLVLGPIGALFAGLTLDYSVRAVASPIVRSRLRTALLLGVVGAAVGPALTLLATAGGTLTLDRLSLGITAAALGGQGMAALSLFLFWLAFQEARRNLEAGKPAPVLPRMEQVYPWLYRPWYPYPYAPPSPQPPEPPKS